MMGYRKADQSKHNQTSLYHRVKKLLVSYEWSDCSFSVAGKKMKAHKLILGISSPVFEAMFYGPLSSDDDILITDIQPDIFQLVLNYIYTDTAELSTIDQAFELIYASRKYMLDHLTEMCITYIQGNTSVDNVIEVLNYPDFMQDKQIITFTLKLFCQHPNYLLEEKKNLITCSSLKAFLESDHMNISEKDLIKHVFEWSTYGCKQNNVEDTLANRRNILKNYGLLQLLRFLTLNVNELDEIVSDMSNILLPHEYEAIKKGIKSSNTVAKDMVESIGVTNFPRNILKLKWHLCYRSPIRSVPPIVIDSNNNIIHARLKMKKSIFINTVCVPTRISPVFYFSNNTPKDYSEQMSVSIECESDSSDFKLTNFAQTVEFDTVVDIELAEPCLLKKDEWYKFSFMWPQNTLQTYCYGVELRHRLYTGHKVAFEFDDLSFRGGNVGSFLGGLKFCL